MKQKGKMNYLTPVLTAVYVIMQDVILSSGPQEVGAEWTWGGLIQ